LEVELGTDPLPEIRRWALQSGQLSSDAGDRPQFGQAVTAPFAALEVIGGSRVGTVAVESPLGQQFLIEMRRHLSPP
jgi:hypothetical protein